MAKSVIQPAKRERPHREDRQEQLLDVAERLFVERRYPSVTMEEITTSAGVTRSLANFHFGSEEGIYVACLERAVEALGSMLKAAIDRTAPARHQLAQGWPASSDQSNRTWGKSVRSSPPSADT